MQEEGERTRVERQGTKEGKGGRGGRTLTCQISSE